MATKSYRKNEQSTQIFKSGGGVLKVIGGTEKSPKSKSQTLQQAAFIGLWGDIIFQVNSDHVLTFNNFRRSYSPNWAEHKIIGSRSKLEWQSPGMDEVTMEVVLNAERGVKPRKMIEKIQKAANNATVEYLYVGGKKVSKNKMYISNCSEAWNVILNKGELLKATLQLTFKEYR